MSTGNFSDAFGDERGRASLRTVDARLGKLRAQVGDDPDLALAGLARMAKEELLDLPDWRSITDPLRPAAFEDIVAALCTLVIEQAADRALPFITDRLDDLKVHPKTRPSLFSDEVRSQAQATVRRQIIWGLDDETQNRTVADLVKEAVGSLDHTLLLAAAQLLRAEPGAL